MSYWGLGNRTASLQKLASALSQKYKISIKFHHGGETTHTNAGKKEISVDMATAFEHGEDHTVGLILHEVAHIRHSPAKIPVVDKKHTKVSQEVYNWIEDRRIDGLMAAEYAGAEQFQSALQDPALEGIQALLESNRPDGVVTIENPDGSTDEGVYNLPLYLGAIGRATLEALNKDIRFTSTGSSRLDRMTAELARLYKAIDKNSTGAEVEAAAAAVMEILSPFIPPEPPGGTGEGEGKGEEGQDEHHHIEYGGRGVSIGGAKAEADRLYEAADARAKPGVELLKKKLLMKLRDTEHQRYIGDQKRGLLDKKRLVRVAHKNFRIYRKRIEPKGKKYSFAVVLDCSGSMYHHGGKRIGNAMQSAAMLLRATRGLGFSSSLTIYGEQSKTVLSPRDRYAPAEIGLRMSLSTHEYYKSGDNQTHEGITEALAILKKSAGERVLVVITDGGLDSPDIGKSKILIENAKKKGVHTILYYVESHSKILQDNTREKTLKNANELIPATLDLIKTIKV